MNRFANVLKKLGVRRGDRVAIYLPMIPEVVVAMLACARIGAIHSVVFGGFSSESLRDRINDAEAKVLITADGGYRRGQVVPLKRNADKAIEECPSIEHVVVVMRRPGAPATKPVRRSPRGATTGGTGSWQRGRVRRARGDGRGGHPLHPLHVGHDRESRRASCTRPAAISSACAATMKLVFDLKDADVFWCTADVGWVTGHSYLVYGPLANGATCVMYEGAPDWPDKDRFWDICERYGVTIFYTAPTAIRAFMKWGAHLPQKHDLSHASPARLGRRADQSRSVDVVPRAHRRRRGARSSTRGGRRRRARS